MITTPPPSRPWFSDWRLWAIVVLVSLGIVAHLAQAIPSLDAMAPQIPSDVHHVLYLVPVVFAAYFYGAWAGGLVVLASQLAFIPHALMETGAGRNEHSPVELAAVAGLGLGISWLVGRLRAELKARKEALAQLSASEQRYAALLEHASDAIVITEPQEGHILAANRRAVELFGRRRQELLALPFSALFLEESQHRAQRRFRQVVEKGYTAFNKIRVRRGDGSTRFADVRASLVPTEGGPVVQVILRDVTERYAAQEERARRIQRLTILNQVSTALIRSLDLDPILEQALDLMLELTQMDTKAGIFLVDEKEKVLRLVVHRGLSPDFVSQESRVPLGECLCGLAAQRGELIYSPDSAQDPRHTRTPLAEPHGHIIIPLRSPQGVAGVMSLYPSPDYQPSEEDLHLLEMMGNEIGLALHNARLYRREQKGREQAQRYAQEAAQAHRRLEEAYLRTIRTLVATLEARDSYTGNHSERVTLMALQMAEKMGVTEKDKEALSQAAELHDLGKVAIPDGILRKSGRLGDAEWAVMRTHPVRTVEMLQGLEFLQDALPIIRAHHERYDGSGYPDGLKGEKIPLLARILAVADAYDALTSDRPYRAAFSPEEAMEILKKNAGKQWDPQAVASLLAILAEPVKAS